jgi:PiT family inorganic phosphate transporter
VAAIIWNLITWWRGIPSSSSHTLIGGFAGAAVAHTGTFSVINQGVILKTIGFIFLAPVIGMAISYVLAILLMWISKRLNLIKPIHGSRDYSLSHQDCLALSWRK